MPGVKAPESLPVAEERVLSTLNRDGSRRWIRPKLSRGRFHRRRLFLGWFLILLFTAIPYIKVNGKPLMLLDIANRHFVLFGKTFLSTDTFLLMLFVVAVLITIFLLTAILGRVWCGWACPQTVYMELLYRPLERLIEGSRQRQLKLDREGPDWRRLVKKVVFILPSIFLAHTFLAYFVGVEQLVRWVQGSPTEHPIAFLVMALTTIAMYLDFGYFREQVCVVACPYGRFQSVLLDRRSLIVGYDERRGEPRGKLRKDAGGDVLATDRGDCIDCKLCVTTCPTGIDIREGLQMECINCTQCIDACDAVMDRIGKPRGLIRYSSQEELAGESRKLFRPRVVLYPLVLVVVLVLFVWTLATKKNADVTVLRAAATPYTTLESGEIMNRIRVKIANRDDRDHDYDIAVVGQPEVHIKTAQNPLAVKAGHTEMAGIFVIAPPSTFVRGRKEIRLKVTDGHGFEVVKRCKLLGPYSTGGAGSKAER